MYKRQISHWHGANGRKTGRNLAATIIGAFTYSGMYIGEKIIGMMIVGSAFVPAVVGNAASIVSSLINAVVGIIVAMLLTPEMCIRDSVCRAWWPRSRKAGCPSHW